MYVAYIIGGFIQTVLSVMFWDVLRQNQAGTGILH